ncbi:hypothetical protein [Phenylobacterium sp.]|uniref:hypothetical protein n=1 Tax=Phenylobacterium sp. TaxID=1871053 RepID=UPI0035B113C6|nr:hypothetical protein [Pseudomonadota bacterium]
MSISSISSVPAGGAAVARGSASAPRGEGNLLFAKRFGSAADRLAALEDEADLAAMMDLAGLTGGNNDSAAFAARPQGAESAGFVDSLREVLAEGGLASWLVTGESEPMSLADLRAEVTGGEVLPSYGLAPRLPDPAAPDYLDQVRRRLIGIGEAGAAPQAQDALDRVLREERARMTERMVAQLARGAHG